MTLQVGVRRGQVAAGPQWPAAVGRDRAEQCWAPRTSTAHQAARSSRGGSSLYLGAHAVGLCASDPLIRCDPAHDRPPRSPRRRQAGGADLARRADSAGPRGRAQACGPSASSPRRAAGASRARRPIRARRRPDATVPRETCGPCGARAGHGLHVRRGAPCGDHGALRETRRDDRGTSLFHVKRGARRAGTPLFHVKQPWSRGRGGTSSQRQRGDAGVHPRAGGSPATTLAGPRRRPRSRERGYSTAPVSLVTA